LYHIVSLTRFRSAQDDPYSGFDTALSELRAGRKTGHWIWYVFPQLAGLGMSEMSRIYGIEGPGEAAAYLRDPVLRGRLLSAATAVAEQLRAGVPLARLMGSSIDVVKLVSSMTLFGATAERIQDREVADRANEILEAAEAQGHPRCRITLQSLRD
jgi:uncharacterized protein (DUF1810 family)